MYASVIELQYIIVLGKFFFRLFRASINHVIAIDIDGTHKTAFSKWFSYFGELRSICPSATLLVLRLRNLEETEFEISRNNKRNNTVTKHQVKNFKNLHLAVLSE
jgi:hypothetical protein